MGKTRDLSKKIRYTKGKFHAKMGTIKERNGGDLTETEMIKKKGDKTTSKIFLDSLSPFQLTIDCFSRYSSHLTSHH